MNLETLSTNEKISLKNKIIIDLYNSKAIHKKVEGMCYRNNIAEHTFIAEDCIQEVFYHLSKYPIDKLLEMHFDNPTRIIGLSVTIASWKCFSKSKVGYPKHSLAFHILFTSNYQQLSHYNPTEEGADENDTNHHLVLPDASTVPDNIKELWEMIREQLTEEENQDLEYFLNLKKKQGRYQQTIKAKYNHLLKRIEEIIIKNKILI